MSRVAAAASGVAALILSASFAAAQTIPDAPRSIQEPLVSTYAATFLQDLPGADNLFHILDVLQPSIIADRFSSGGLSIGQPARVGGFLTSWSQTLFSIDGVPFTDPTGNGRPMLSPELMLWSGIRVATGAFDADSGVQGLGIDLRPPSPAGLWTGTVESVFSHGRMNSTGSASPTPPVSRVASYDRVGFTTSGPLVKDRVGATFAFSGTRGSQFDRGDVFGANARALSLLTQFVFTPNAVDRIRVLGFGQQTDVPAPFRHILVSPTIATTATSGGHGQLVWTHQPDTGAPWLLSAGYSDRRDMPDYGTATSGILERLTSGPVTQFSALARRTVRAWSGAAQMDPRIVSGSVTHHISLGVQGEGGQLLSSAAFNGAIGELVSESPARVWQFTASPQRSDRNVATLAGFVEDHASAGDRATISGGLRFESVGGSARGAAQGVRWLTLLPRAGLTFKFTESFHTTVFASYGRSGQRLALDALAIGDPGASTAAVYRWTGLAGYPLSLDDRGALLAIVGPGTGSNPALSTINPDLKRPTSDEFVLGVQTAPSSGILIRLAGLSRKEHNLASIANVGAPAYTTFTTADPGSNFLGTDDDATLTIYNRVPSSYLNDLFQLTTPGHSGSTFRGVELTLQFQTTHVTIAGGATAGIAKTFANSAGYGPLENDQTVLGELFTDPNTAGLAHGRPFTDRAYTGKFASVFRLPAEIRIGMIARYQDGQPFSRVVVFPGLNQGAEPVRAFFNGESRFKFVGTLDLRLQKTFRAGTRRVDAFVDAYNVLNMRNSVEEDIGNLPDVRIDTALQPPLTVHAGLRFTF